MKTSLAWLNSYLDRPCHEAEVEAALTRVGFPLDGREDVTTTAGVRDVMLDIEITSNRGDCLSHLGLAREAAAATGRTVKMPDCDLPNATGKPAGQLTSVDNQPLGLCPLYTARVITGVKIGPSPAWLVDRLEAVGLRPVNNVVDITNFVLLELGQPLHAFDMNRLAEKRIVVRRATQGEKFTAIDGSKHELRDTMLVIADAKRPVAVAGVMGGVDSEVSDKTTDILLESAIFDPLSVQRTSRALKLASDSSYRFERGVDPTGVDRASRRAAQLIIELAGGTLAEGVVRVGQDDPEPRRITLRSDRCKALLGLDISADEQAEHLSRLDLSPQLDNGSITCTIPPHRLDLHREVDLIEEIARSHGLDDIPIEPDLKLTVKAPQAEVVARGRLAEVLIAHGYHETITPTLLTRDHAKAFCPSFLELMSLAGETRRKDAFLRPSLLPSLLECRKFNQDRGNDGVRLFEVARIFGYWEKKPCEVTSLALLNDAPDPQAGLRQARGTIEELVRTLGGDEALDTLELKPAEDRRYTGGAAISLFGEERGRMGVLSAELQDQFGLQTSVVLVEVDYDPFVSRFPPQRRAGELPRFPAIERDLSVIVDEPVPWRQIDTAVRGSNPDLLERIEFVGTYRGKPIPKGKKSVTFRMLFRDPRKTLRHDQVDPQVAAVVEALRQSVNAELRA